MKFTSFLFLLFFTQLTAKPNNFNLTPNSGFKVWKINAEGVAEKILFKEKATYKFKPDLGYLLINIQEDRYDIVYFLGDQPSVNTRVTMIKAVAEALNEVFRNLPESDTYIRQIRPGPRYGNYRALLEAHENKKIPRLYRVDRPDAVYKVKIDCSGFQYNNVSVLYDGSAVTIFHSKPKNSENDTTPEEDASKIKTAFLLARYIVQVEKLKENSIRFLNETEKSSADAKRLFVDKLVNLVKKKGRKSTIVKDYMKKSSKLFGTENKEPEEIQFVHFGPEKCMMSNTISPLYDTFRSECVYLMRDYDANEFVIVFGRKSAMSEQQSALEIVAKNHFIFKSDVKFIVEGEPLPTIFMINFKSEVERYLRDSSEDGMSSNK